MNSVLHFLSELIHENPLRQNRQLFANEFAFFLQADIAGGKGMFDNEHLRLKIFVKYIKNGINKFS